MMRIRIAASTVDDRDPGNGTEFWGSGPISVSVNRAYVVSRLRGLVARLVRAQPASTPTAPAAGEEHLEEQRQRDRRRRPPVSERDIWMARCQGCGGVFALEDLHRTASDVTRFECGTCCPRGARFEDGAPGDGDHAESRVPECRGGSLRVE